jgi:HlyD family secretion protein
MANPKNRKRRKLLVSSAIILALIGLGLYAYFRRPNVIITVQTEKISRRNLTELVVANGKIQPVTFVKISPEVSGELIELPVKEGQFLKKGDLLFKIKPDFYQANRNSVEASLQSALANVALSQAQLTRAELELKRQKELFDSHLVSDAQYLEAKTTWEVAKASYEQATHQTAMARASLARADEELSKTTVYSPLTGTISKLNSQLGERVVGTATYQGTEVMTISDLTDMEARVDIGEVDVVLIKVGQKARLEVDAFRDRKFTGAVTEIANTAKTSGAGSQQEATKFEVRIRVQEKEVFRPGMSVTAEIETRTRTNVLTVPIQSVTSRLPKEPTTTTGKQKTEPKPEIKSGAQAATTSSSTAAAPAAPATNTTARAPAGQTNSASTNAVAGRKPNEAPKPVEVVFLVDNGQAKMVKVTRGISDETHVEIIEGLKEDQEVVSGGYKAINRELEEGKPIKVDNSKPLWQDNKAEEKK